MEEKKSDISRYLKIVSILFFSVIFIVADSIKTLSNTWIIIFVLISGMILCYEKNKFW